MRKKKEPYMFPWRPERELLKRALIASKKKRMSMNQFVNQAVENNIQLESMVRKFKLRE